MLIADCMSILRNAEGFETFLRSKGNDFAVGGPEVTGKGKDNYWHIYNIILDNEKIGKYLEIYQGDNGELNLIYQVYNGYIPGYSLNKESGKPEDITLEFKLIDMQPLQFWKRLDHHKEIPFPL